MSDCCTAKTGSTEACAVPVQETKAETVTHCPLCGHRGKGVDIQTVKALLAVSLGALQADRYRFCRTQTCPIVYFAADSAEQYREDDLREQVHQKHPDADDVFICYCFRYTPGMIRSELHETGKSTVADRINAGIGAGQCACEIRNPQGSCCLGNVTTTVKRLQAAL